MGHQNLVAAQRAKNDEFYTQYEDIEKEVSAYIDYQPDVFTGKVIYCNCDDPFESNFFAYFALNFNTLGLKQLITTSYQPSPVANTRLELFPDLSLASASLEAGRQMKKKDPTANRFIINETGDMDGNGEFNLENIADQLKANKNNEWAPLKGNGDFNSDESIELLKQSDIVITNPPFSLFRKYVSQLVKYEKKFLIIGNKNAITYNEVFPLIKMNKLWVGHTSMSKDMLFDIPEEHAKKLIETKKAGSAYKFVGDAIKGRSPSIWYSNLEHGRRHQPIPLMTEKEVIKYSTKMPFEKYDNYDAIEIGKVKDIPSDYKGIMGVPISFLDKYCPDQFEILGMCENLDIYKLKTKVYSTDECKKAYRDKFKKSGTYDLNAAAVVIRNGLREKVYQRILIRHKRD